MHALQATVRSSKPKQVKKPVVKTVAPKPAKKPKQLSVRAKQEQIANVKVLKSVVDKICKKLRTSRPNVKKIIKLTKSGLSDTAAAVQLGIKPTTVLYVRSTLLGIQPTRPSCKPVNKKTKPTKQFGQPGGNKAWWTKIGDDGLPIVPEGIGRPKGAVDLIPFLHKLSTYSKQEIKSIIKHRDLNGQSLSINTVGMAQMYLDTLHSDPNVRRAATKLLLDRRFGTALTRVGNADGSNINPLLSLLDPSTSKLKPKK